MPIIVNGTTINDYSPGVNVNGTAMQEVYINGTKVWARYPYPVGTTIFTYSWGPGNNIDGFRTSTYPTYPLAFASAPFYTQGGGSPDSTLRFTLSSGFIVSFYSQAEYGTQTMNTGTTGGTYNIFVGNTVSGLSGTNITLPGSGNGSSSFTVKYIGN
jgi:hypothetical protein